MTVLLCVFAYSLIGTVVVGVCQRFGFLDTAPDDSITVAICAALWPVTLMAVAICAVVWFVLRPIYRWIGGNRG